MTTQDMPGNGGPPCPKCRRRTILVAVTVMAVPAARSAVGAPLARLYGKPDPVMVGDESAAFCNSIGCDWEGSYADVVPTKVKA